MIKHSTIKDGRGNARVFDPRTDASDLLEALRHRDPSVSRDVLAQIDALPAYVKNWDGTKRITEDIHRRFALLGE